MQTTTPKTAAKVAALNLTPPHQTSRFPTSSHHPEREEPTDLQSKSEDLFSGEDWAESARNEVRAHPLAIVGVALVAGLIIGRL